MSDDIKGSAFHNEELPDNDLIKEMNAISDMLKKAKEHNLEVEVVSSFGESMCSYGQVINSTVYALSEWDLL